MKKRLNLKFCLSSFYLILNKQKRTETNEKMKLNCIT